MQLFFSIPRVARAFVYAVDAHGDQMYGTLPYFTHVLAVAEAVSSPTEDELVAALLHDVVEDTGVSVADVRAVFGDNVADIVALLTKDAALDYDANINKIIVSRNRSAMRIKWADNLVNMRNDKSHMTPERRERLNAKYAKSFLLLSSVLGV